MASNTFQSVFERINRHYGGSATFNGSDDLSVHIRELINHSCDTLNAVVYGYEQNVINSTLYAIKDTYEYSIPSTLTKITEISMLVGDKKWYPVKVELSMWDRLMYMNGQVESNIPQFWTIEANKIKIYPTPSTTFTKICTVLGDIPSTPSTSDIIFINGTIVGYTNQHFYQYSGSSWTDLGTTNNEYLNYIYINGYTNATELTTSDGATSLPIKSGFEDLVVYDVLSDLYLNNENMAMHNTYAKKYDDLFALYKDSVLTTTTSVISKYNANASTPYNNANYPRITG